MRFDYRYLFSGQSHHLDFTGDLLYYRIFWDARQLLRIHHHFSARYAALENIARPFSLPADSWRM